MQYDRQIIISAAGSRKASSWPQQHIYWSEFVEKLRTPIRSTETLEAYQTMQRSRQDDLKDVGGFVGGAVSGRRKPANVSGRDLITLDMDNIPQGAADDVIRRLDSCGCAYAVYSTRKHEPIKPRLRAVFPLDRTATVDEYEPIARKLAQCIGIELCDSTTFEVARLMYWPSCCADSQYIFYFGDKPFLSADGMLAAYADWRDVSEWPQVPGAQQARTKLAAKQGDPTAKSGIVGAFCKTYDIQRAISELLPEVYDACDDSRFTYTEGSTVGGAVLYDNGAFLYSHHATDPAGGRLCNAFDLIRLHKYGALDDDAKPDTPVNKLPSYAAMCEFAVSDTYVASLLNAERYEKVLEEFAESPSETMNWMQLLQVNSKTGMPAKTSKNVRIAIENDPNLKDKICWDAFSEYIMATGPFPWGCRESDASMFRWQDSDYAGLRDYIQQIFGFRSKEILDDALILCAQKRSYNPIVSYLKTVSWDGTPRLDTLFIDYLGAEDCLYTRTVTRKVFTAAVARAMDPGVKFDCMPVIHGKQGIGKSTLIFKVAVDWFSDSIKTFEGKDAAELLQGVWILELGEMEAYSKTDVRAVKSFLSKRDDQYRAAYARTTEKHLRKCVFIGTTNDHNYLRDTTGNRRFWPIDAMSQPPVKNVHTDLTKEDIAQIWAEAYVRWQAGEALYLAPEMEAEAEKRRDVHFDRDPLQGQIEEFLETAIPEDWQDWSAERRRMFWNGQMKGNAFNLVLRDRVCAAEIWRECMGMFGALPKADAHRINGVLEMLPGWERVSTIRFGSGYGRQKGFKRKASG